jgi:hypothetical protein
MHFEGMGAGWGVSSGRSSFQIGDPAGEQRGESAKRDEASVGDGPHEGLLMGGEDGLE